MKESLALRVLVISGLFLGLPLLLSSFLLFRSTYQNDVSAARATLREAATYRAESLVQLQAVSPIFAQELDFFLDFGGHIKKKEYDALSRKLKDISLFRSGLDLFILSPEDQGKFHVLAASKESTVPHGYVSYHSFKLLNTKRSEILTFWPIEGTIKGPQDPPYLFFLSPIEDASGTLLGYLLIASHISEKLTLLLSRSLDYEQEVNYALLQSDGIVIAAGDPALIGNYFFPLTREKRIELAEQMESMRGFKISDEPLAATSSAENNSLEFAFGRSLEIGYLHRILGTNATLLAYSAKDAIFAGAIRHFFLFYTLFGFVIVVGSIITYKLTGIMSRPLGNLSRLMQKVQAGDYNERFSPEPLGFEINFLGNVFNEMIDSVLENMKKEEDNRVAKETYAKELEIGEKVQRQLLPQEMPKIEGVEVFAKYIPSKVVGGDFYDIGVVRGKLRLLVADGLRKGFSSCIYSLLLRSEIRAYSTMEDAVAVILAKAANLFHIDTKETKTTMKLAMGNMSIDTKEICYYSAGHAPGYLRKRDGTVTPLQQVAPEMGKLFANPKEPLDFFLEEGDLLFLYTAGLIEGLEKAEGISGQDRIRKLLEEKPWITAKEVVEGFAREIEKYPGTEIATIEAALVAMKIEKV